MNESELLRYSRQLALPAVGVEGQRKLRAARVAIVGVGGLGSPAATYLAAAGIGTIGLIDPDRVELSNLHRQPLYSTSRQGQPKVSAAAERLHDLNPHVEIRTYAEALTSDNALAVLGDYDVVLDGTDRFATRYLVNDACVLLGRPNVYASVLKFDGQLSVFGHAGGPCYRCLFPDPPPYGSVPSCAEAGVLGVLPGVMGTLQATEAIKLILGIGQPLAGRLLVVDALGMTFRTIQISNDPDCPACGTRVLTQLGDYEAWCGTPQVRTPSVRQLSPATLAEWIAAERVQLIDVREPWEFDLAHIAGSVLIPLGRLPNECRAKIDATLPVAVLCHHGARSYAAVEYLMRQGYGDVYNVEGGIDRYSREVDTAVPRY